MKTFIKKLGLYCFFLHASFWFSIFAEIVYNIPLKLVLKPSDLAWEIIEFCLSTICIIITLFILCYGCGYKQQKFNLKQVIVIMLSLLIIHQIASLLQAYYIAGPAYPLSRIIYYMDENAIETWYMPLGLLHPLIAIFDIIFVVPTMVLGEYMVVKKYKSKHKTEPSV